MGRFEVLYRPEVQEDLDLIPRNIQLRIRRAIESRLASAPHRYGERLRRSLLGLWKLRVGDYRIIYDVRGGAATVWMIAHRKEVYSKAEKRRR